VPPIRLIDGVNRDKEVKQLLHDGEILCCGVRSKNETGHSTLGQTNGCDGRVMPDDYYLAIRDADGGERTWCSACALENCPEIVEKAQTQAGVQAVRSGQVVGSWGGAAGPVPPEQSRQAPLTTLGKIS